MYFENRSRAGQQLAASLVTQYRYENCAVVALTTGGVLVGEQIAAQLHCPFMLLLSESIDIPGENTVIGAVADGGSFTYNSELSKGELDEYTNEFHGYFNEKRREALSRLNRLVGDGGVIEVSLLKDRHIILVSDGFYDPGTIDSILEVLKPIRTGKLVFAAPVATVSIVDRLHVIADELHILDVKPNFLGVDHYYEDNTLPSVSTIVEKISQIVLNWR